jgi:hypothetical protein
MYRRRVTTREIFEPLRLLTPKEEEEYHNNFIFIVNPEVSLMLYEEEKETFISYDYQENVLNSIRVGMNTKDVTANQMITFIFDQMRTLSHIDFEIADGVIGPLFWRFNNLLKKMTDKVIPNTSIDWAIKIADKLENPLPVDYALTKGFFNIPVPGLLKRIAVISEKILFRFIINLFNKYNNMEQWFLQIMVFKIFKELGINRLNYVRGLEVQRDASLGFSHY